MRQIIQDPPDLEIEQVTLKSIEGYHHNKIYASFRDTHGDTRQIKILNRVLHKPSGFLFQTLTLSTTHTPFETVAAAILHMLETSHMVYEFDSHTEFYKWAASVS